MICLFWKINKFEWLSVLERNGIAIMRFKLITTLYNSASKILADYPQLTNKVEVVDDNAYITIDKVEKLMELTELAGEIVVGANFIGTHEPVIEIYDGYRE